jgi:hypothetical protein
MVNQSIRRLLFDLTIAILLLVIGPTSSLAQSINTTYEGFGAQATGGQGKPVYQVTNLNDSGTGSLRDALSQGDRHIVFSVGGEILLQSRLFVQGANVTIDGLTAPDPGITLRNYGLRISGIFGASNVIVRGIRVQIAANVSAEDGIAIISGAHNIVIDHVSIRGATDESIGLNDVQDVTVSWSILADPIDSHNTNMLITNRARRISIHHNLFLRADRRNPWVAWVLEEDLGVVTPPEAPEIQADIVNNLMWDVSGSDSDHGTVVFGGGKANIINNYYKTVADSDSSAQKRAIVVCREIQVVAEDLSFCESRVHFPPARAYVTGNVSQDGWSDHLNSKGSETLPFYAPVIDTTDACAAAHQVRSAAGARPLDSLDQLYLSSISLPACGNGVAPTLLLSSNQLDFSTNLGSNPAPKTISITEAEGGQIAWIANASGSWVSLSNSGATTPSNVAVNANSSGLSAGKYFGVIEITAPAAQNSPVYLPVNLVVNAPAQPAGRPVITSPTPGSTLPGAAVTFTWSANGAKVKKWQLYVGTGRGLKNIFDSGKLSSGVISRSVSIPAAGSPIWAQLRFEVGGNWQFADFEYSAASP